MGPDLITREPGLVPGLAFRAGDPMRSPKDRQLPGTRRDARWRYALPTHDERDFFAPISALVEHLAPHRDFFRRIVHDGGSVTVSVNLSGERNIGDVLGSGELRKLADFEIGLGVEVFPNFQA